MVKIPKQVVELTGELNRTNQVLGRPQAREMELGVIAGTSTYKQSRSAPTYLASEYDMYTDISDSHPKE